jgi:predicted ArsR family transcriptional regulator
VVADFSPGRHEAPIESRAEAAPEPAAPTKNTTAQALLSMLKRRPCSLDDISASLGISRNEAMTHIRTLQRRELILPVEKGGRTFFKAVT